MIDRTKLTPDQKKVADIWRELDAMEDRIIEIYEDELLPAAIHNYIRDLKKTIEKTMTDIESFMERHGYSRV